MLAEGNKLYSVSAADNLGTSASSTGTNVQVDNTGPSVTTVIAATTWTSPQGFVKQGGTYRVYANASDLPAAPGTFSGLDAATLAANVSTVSAGPSAVAHAHALWRLRPGLGLRLPDGTADGRRGARRREQAVLGPARRQPGHERELLGANVQVDNTAPSVGTVIANTTTNQPGWLRQGSGYRVYANVTELPAGPGASSGLNASSITADVSNVTTGQTAVR